MLKKITRRRFVSSLSVLAAMPLLSPRAVRAATGKTVSVDRYNNNDWIAAFKQAFTEGDTVVVPAGLTCENINTGIFIPDGKTLLIRGKSRTIRRIKSIHYLDRKDPDVQTHIL